MQLTVEEEKILAGEFGIAQQEGLKFLIRYGDALGAERLVDVQSVHTAMAVPEQFTKILKGSFMVLNQILLCSRNRVDFEKLKVFSTTHVGTCEPEHFAEFRISEEVVQANKEVRDYYAKKGLICTATCTPYLVGNIPIKGNHIAWMESSAVVYANSVIGALGNIEGIESSFAAAITGKIPYAGFHIPENRRAKIIFQVDAALETQADFDALGYYVGGELENLGMGLEVPLLTGLHPAQATQDNFKGMGAAMATSGAIQLYHAEGITPEACAEKEGILADPEKTTKVKITTEEIAQTYEKLSTAADTKVDLVILGCPHFSLNQIKETALLLEGKRVHKDVQLWVFVPAGLKELAMSRRFGQTIEAAGGMLLVDTCPALMLFKPENVKVVACNSAKQIHYYSALVPGITTWFGSLTDCVNAAISGKWEPKRRDLK